MSMLTTLVGGGQSAAQVQAAIDSYRVPLPGWTAGLYYGNDTQGAVAGFGTAALSASFLYAFWVATPSEGATIDRIGAEVTTISAGKSFRLATYLPDGVRRRPSSLIFDSGLLSAGVTGFIEATIAAALPGNGVWFSMQVEDGTMQFRLLSSASRIAVVGKAAGGGTTANGGIIVARAFGAFPATFPTGEVPISSAPVINVRAV